MRKVVKWLVITIIVFLILCGISYHNSLNNDGSLYFGFPKEIYHKAALVMFADTGEISGTENFYAGHLVIDICFAAIIAMILVGGYKMWLRRRRG